MGLATAMQIGMSMPQQAPAAVGPILTDALHLTRALAAWLPPRRRGVAMGIRHTGVTAAGLLAAALLPPLALAFGWQAAFRAVAGIALCSALVFALFYPEPARPLRGEDWPLDFTRVLRNRTFLMATAFGWIFMAVLGATVTYLTVSS